MAESVQEIPVRFIQFPTLYIRETPNKEIVDQWASELREAKEWIFDKPVEVWVPSGTDEKGKSWLDKGKRFELVDGYKRTQAAIDSGVIRSVPAIIRTFPSHKEAFAYQYQTAKDHGEFLTKKQRNYYVRTMRDVFKLKLEEIATITKISKSQASRIARNITTRKGGGGGRPKAKRFTVKGYLEEVRFLGIQYQNYSDSVDKYVADKGSELATFFKALVRVLPLLAQEEPQEA